MKKAGDERSFWLRTACGYSLRLFPKALKPELKSRPSFLHASLEIDRNRRQLNRWQKFLEHFHRYRFRFADESDTHVPVVAALEWRSDVVQIMTTTRFPLRRTLLMIYIR